MIADVQFSIYNITGESLVIVLVGYVICFISLAVLSFIFQKLPLLIEFNPKKLFRKKTEEVVAIKNDRTMTGEETAAISTAIFLFLNEIHDEESSVLTINKISKKYSPWSSKIYNVTNGLNKRF
jgi:glutaconyl-CoA/methylmalonyl-CoA decarboxylase subunit delta